ncbi:peptide chain release factor 2 [Actinobacillus equuli subsp. haemolyticus]|uniref:peptide chain release factor 2 n=1 Tax=Actinobacillus TaxID=713 RepID=UPI002441A9A7|nr:MULTISPECIES: peptide chain release factor 2 [Actinobacillus]WGE34308.1 peptide chain release factor 2 [Actinobacillus genomosp. 1]WGE47628.1 peptide chain release factor 2 [Actinobacillus equuli subsp. haemolyticus]WGE67955.1 peptide chain release factor 2 [Actinobacillus equuli subsp. haemolyticus]WGE80306.1 peptide chain release factor 2 [Actinobacillus equuli subsp. equuli]
MFELNPIKTQLADLTERTNVLRGYLDFDAKVERLEEVNAELEQPEIWNTPEKAQALGKERSALEMVVNTIRTLGQGVEDVEGLIELAVEAEDEDTFNEAQAEANELEEKLAKLEFQRMFSGQHDAADCYVDLQAGSGGTEAQDWTEMLLRMYLRWAESKGFKTELIEVSDGDVAGLKSATVKITGEYAFGWLRTETGIHRLVRKSPFDSNNRRHTSFAAAFVYPEIDDDIDIEINPADLRIDVYRASGAGGQHVNKTESAVRITHIPSGIVVQCQNGRSQHQNKDQCMKQLKAKLYEMEMMKKNAEKQAMEESKSDIGWGSQIRSYVLDDSRIKDLRTGVENRNTQAVLDGDLDKFIEASLKAGL